MNPRRRQFLLYLAALLATGCQAGKRDPPAQEAGESAPAPTAAKDEATLTRERVMRGQQERQRLISQLWDTSLGRMFYSYVKDDVSGQEAAARSHYITNVIYRQPELVFVRVAAIQLLTENLYSREQLEHDELARIVMLQNDIWARRISSQRSPAKTIAIQAVVVLVAMLPFGSPIFRKGTKNVYLRLKHSLGAALRRKKDVYRQKNIQAVPLGEVFSREFFKDYELTKAFKTFLDYFGPYSLAFFFWSDWKETARGAYEEDNVMLYGLTDLVKILSDGMGN